MHVVKVAQRGRIGVDVYPEEGQPHDRPHCHVYWPDGETVVALDRLEILAGMIPPAAALKLVRDNLSAIKQAWMLLNPRRPVA
jgi:hypothetical protein